MKRLLVLDEEFPFPLNTGKRIRSFNLLKHLASEFQISYLAFGRVTDPGHEALRRLGIHVVPVPPLERRKAGPRFYGRLARNLMSPLPFIVDEHFDPRYVQALRDLLSSAHYDAIIVEWTPYAHYVAGLGEIPHIIVAHNVESKIWEGYQQHAGNVFQRLFLTHQLGKLRPFETRVWREADGVVVVSREEEESVRQEAPDTELACVPNGVDVKHYTRDAERNKDDEVNGTVVFTGSMDWRPNQDAVYHYQKDILPHILREVPRLRSFVVGREPPPGIRRLNGENGILVTGQVEDVRPYLGMASVVIVPLRIGAGSRLKILEALAAGKAVVSTRCGYEGLELQAGRDLLVADSPREFARDVVRLLANPDLRAQIAQSGRRVVQEKYDWSRVYRSYRDLIDHVTAAEPETVARASHA